LSGQPGVSTLSMYTCTFVLPSFHSS
jgi:hypothetical protein